MGWLKYGLESRRHERKWWLKAALQPRSLLGTADKDVRIRVLSDYKSQLAHVEGMEEFADANKIEFEDPRRSKNSLVLWRPRCAGRIGNYHSASMGGAPLEPSRGG